MDNKFKAQKPRRKTREVIVGDIGIGKNNPIRVQTMTNTDTLNTEATVNQIIECIKAGTEIIRISTQTPTHAKQIKIIKTELAKHNLKIPIVADVHYLPAAAFEALKYADKIRLNPGNFIQNQDATKLKYSDEEYKKELINLEKNLKPFIEEAKKYNTPLRIGSNLGSLSNRIIDKYGNTAEAMVKSTMEYLHIFKDNNYENLVVALKAADPLTMIEANRILINEMEKQNMDYPIHLGVTEAGSDDDGRTKSTIGIGTLLLDGIGDTIRVSLTEKPSNEIPVCFNILQATRRRITKTEFISCPGCGRTNFDIEKVSSEIKSKLSHLKGLKIAIMGCVVNGPGEMGDADYGYIGGKKSMINLYHKKTLVKADIPEKKAVDMLIDLIKENGQWQTK